MNKFVAQLNDGSFINTCADRMEVVDDMLFAYKENSLVAMIEVTAIIAAHIREDK